jgi:hypothetical protein
MTCANCVDATKPVKSCSKCHQLFCPNCLTLQRDLAGDLDPVDVCFKCDGVVGAVGHQRRQSLNEF